MFVRRYHHFDFFSMSSCICVGLILESLATLLSTGQGTMLFASTRENATRNVDEKIDLEMAALLDAFIILSFPFPFLFPCYLCSVAVAEAVAVPVAIAVAVGVSELTDPDCCGYNE